MNLYDLSPKGICQLPEEKGDCLQFQWSGGKTPTSAPKGSATAAEEAVPASIQAVLAKKKLLEDRAKRNAAIAKQKEEAEKAEQDDFDDDDDDDDDDYDDEEAVAVPALRLDLGQPIYKSPRRTFDS